MKPEIKSLAAEWGVPLLLGVSIIGSCELTSYMNSGKTPEQVAAEQAKKPTLTEVVKGFIPTLGR